MSLEQLSKTVDFVQATTPSNANDGETYLDTSQSPPQLKVFNSSANAFVRPRSIQNLDAPVSNAGATQSDIANGVDSSNLSDEITSGRTRELLLLLQDKSVPEIQDPLNIQTALSERYTTNNNDYKLNENISVSDSFNGNDSASNSLVTVFTENVNVQGLVTSLTVDFTVDFGGNASDAETRIIDTTNSNIIVDKDYGFINEETKSVSGSYNPPNNDFDVEFQTTRGDGGTTGNYNGSISYTYDATSGHVTDKFSPPTTGLSSFSQWRIIQARDVTTGSSTSTDPVEFEILDSTNTALNSTRIPKVRIVDEPFTIRNRVYSESAGNNGQSNFTITTTGDGGHFGIPVLTVVSVKKNGSVLESANWSFDGTDTITIDTSNVTIASGDTIDIKYDFDVVDSTLQPRAYLSRESASETSPSISHFKYEYVI